MSKLTIITDGSAANWDTKWFFIFRSIYNLSPLDANSGALGVVTNHCTKTTLERSRSIVGCIIALCTRVSNLCITVGYVEI